MTDWIGVDMTNTTREIRQAADRLQELVGGGTSGPWSVAMDPDTGERNVVYSEFIATRYPDADPTVARISSPQHPEPEDGRSVEWGQTDDAELIATFAPELVDLVAAWLRESADEIEEGPDAEWSAWPLRIARRINRAE